MSRPPVPVSRRSPSVRLKRCLVTLAAATAAAACLGGPAASPAAAATIQPCWIWGDSFAIRGYMGCQYYRPFSRAWVQIYPYGSGSSFCYLRFWNGWSWEQHWRPQYNWYVCNQRQN
jgi:hypothetical protein